MKITKEATADSLPVESQNALGHIQKLLTPMSQEIFKLLGKPASIEQLLRICYKKNNCEETVRAILRELDAPGYAAQSLRYQEAFKTDRQKAYDRTIGSIIAMGNPLQNYGQRKYSALIAKHLGVGPDGSIVRKTKNRLTL